MAESSANSPAEPQRRAWLALGLLLVSYVVFDVLVDPLYRATSGLNREWVIAILLGAVFSQPVLLAIWSVFGSGPIRLRVPLTIGAFASVLLANFLVSWLKYGNSMATPTQNPRLLVALGAIYLAVFAVGFVLSLLTSVGIRPVTKTWIGDAPVRQFSIRYLLGMTTACAVLLGIGRGVVSIMSAAGTTMSAGSLPSLAIDCGVVLILVTAAVALPLVVLAPQPNVLLVAGLVLNWLALTYVSLWILGIVYPSPGSDLMERVLFMQLGAVLNAIVTAIVLRLVGYRFVGRAPALPKD